LVALHYGLGGPNLAFALPAYSLLAVPAVLSVFLIKRRAIAPNHWAVGSFLLFYGYIAARAWFSPVEYLAAEELQLALACLAVYLLFAVVITNPDHRMIFAVTLLILILPHGLLGAYQIARDSGFNLWDVARPAMARAAGMFVNPNNTAAFLLIACSFGLSLLFWARWPAAAKVPVAAVTVLGIVTLVLTLSRGGGGGFLLALVIFATLTFLVYYRFFYWPPYYIFGFLLALVVGGVGILGVIQDNARIDPVANRFAKAAEGYDWREEVLKMGLKQIELDPIKGSGAGSFDYAGTQFRPPEIKNRPVYVHNDYVELVAEYGYIAAALFLLMVGSHAYSGFMNYRRLAFHRLQQSGRATSNALALQLGAIPSLLGMALAICFSFHMQIPGVAIPAVFCLAILANPGSRGDTNPRPMERRSGGGRGKAGKGVAPLTLAWRALIPLLMVWPVVETFRRWPTEYYTYQARRTLQAEQDPLKAIQMLEKALQYDQRNYETYYLLGSARQDLAARAMSPTIKDFYYRNAIDAYEKSIALYPKFLPHRWFLARIFDYYGRYEESDALWQQLLRDDPRGAYNMAYYGLHRYARGDYEGAREAYRKPFVRELPFARPASAAASRALQKQRALEAGDEPQGQGMEEPESADPDPLSDPRSPRGEPAERDPFAPPDPRTGDSGDFELELHIEQQ
jgi:O-antigen ligase